MKVLLTPTPLIAVEIQENENTVTWANKLTLWEGDNFKEPIVFSCREIEVLGTVDKGVIDFDCEPFLTLDEIYYGRKLWTVFGKHYEKERGQHIRVLSTESKEIVFTSLLASHSLSLDKKYLIIKPKN